MSKKTSGKLAEPRMWLAAPQFMLPSLWVGALRGCRGAGAGLEVNEDAQFNTHTQKLTFSKI